MATRDQFEDETIYYNEAYQAPTNCFGNPPSRPSNIKTGPQRPDVYGDPEEYTQRIPVESIPSADTMVYRRQRQQQGPNYVQHDAYGNVIAPSRASRPRPTSTSSQPVRRTEPPRRAVQPQRYVESQKVTTGPVMGRRRLVRKLFAGAILIAATGVLADAPSIREQSDINANHFSQGDVPNKPIYRHVGHNDSIHPTVLDFRVSDNTLVFEETPGGDVSKTRITPIWTLEELKYTGHVADLFLGVDVTPVGKRFTVEVTVKWYEPHLLLWYQFTPAIGTILVDLGHGFFELPPTK